ncbi:MAG: hypothetical protein ACRDTA_17765 [Pseudonocardiaceae bacterium]
MTNAVLFSESYYRQVLAEFDYTPFDLRRFDFSVAGLDPDTLNARYLCHHHGEQYLSAAPLRRIVTTGFGMSGVPHLATVSHVLKMIELQRGGERCQIVLGDLDAYNGKAKPYADVRELADRFREYSLRLGFDPHAGIVRSQESHLPALETMYLLGRYVEQADFDAAEEDNHGYYADRGLVDTTMTFRRALSLSLMAADFLALGQDHDAVLVMLGVDEHRYVRFAQQTRARLDQHVPLRADFALTAAYTRMVRGFGGPQVQQEHPRLGPGRNHPAGGGAPPARRRAEHPRGIGHLPAHVPTAPLQRRHLDRPARALSAGRSGLAAGGGRVRRLRDRPDQPVATLTRRNRLATAR